MVRAVFVLCNTLDGVQLEQGALICIQPSLNFVQGVRRTKWIVEGSKMDFFLLFRGSALVDSSILL